MVFFLPMFFLFSCSWITHFAVANRSDQTVGLTYAFKHGAAGTGCTRCFDIENFGGPETPAGGEFRDAETVWEALPADRFALSEDRCTVALTLEPGQIVKIGSMATYTGHKSGRQAHFRIARLTLQTDKGTITYSDFELVRQFKKKSDLLYVLAYE